MFLPIIFVFIVGTPKHTPITKEAPNIPEINGTKTFFPKPLDDDELYVLDDEDSMSIECEDDDEDMDDLYGDIYLDDEEV